MSGVDNIHALEPTLFNPDEESDFPVARERLDEFVPSRREPEDPAALTSLTSHNPYGTRGDPGLQVIVDNLGRNHTDLHGPHRLGPYPEDVLDRDTVMTDQCEDPEATETPDISPGAEPSAISAKTGFEAKLKGAAQHGLVGGFDPLGLQATASASLRESEAVTQRNEDGEENGMEKRHDSHQEQDLTLPTEDDHGDNRRGSSALTLDTKRAPEVEESIAQSPTLSKHVIMDSDRPETLPALIHHSNAGDNSATSPQSASLPPIHQVVPAQPYRPLNELAEVCTQHDPRNANLNSPSLSSTNTLSPGLPYQLYPGSAHMSPSSQHTFSARSPATTFGDPYGSPTHYSHQMPYHPPRRSSAPTDRGPIPLTSVPSISSSGESHGPASSIDGYSTAHTTPIDPAEATPGRMLPPPPGMIIAPGYKCDAPDCTAPPFQTQYLLSSHRNVHNNSRPHFCPVQDCSRSAGGTGFKRKNEMIRHGLVHESPGYVCPFCPDREHRYPRPDNLQRHVRVHHVDKDRDDPELRAVLAQRPQGLAKLAGDEQTQEDPQRNDVDD